MTGTFTPPGGLSAKEFALQVSEVGHWIWGTTQGAFNEKQTTSQIITDAVIGMIPVVGDVTAARDLIAVSAGLIDNPEKRHHKLEWVLLVILIFALIPVLGGVIKGVGRLALRITEEVAKDSVMVAKVSEEVIAFLNRVGHRNAEAWFKALDVVKYEGEILIKFRAFCDTMILTIYRCGLRFKSILPEAMTKKLESWLIGLKHLKELGEEMIPQALKELHEKLEHLQKYIHSGGLPAPAKAKTVLAQTGQKTVSYAEEARLIESGVPKKIRHAGKYAQNVANTADVARIKKVYTYESGFPNLLDNSVTDAATGASYFNKISAASGPIRNEMLEGETLFRAFGPKGATRGVAVNESNAIGAFWGRGSVPKSAEEWRRKFAVMDEWNRNGWLSMVHIPAGVKIPACTSTVSEQFGKTISGQYLEGGGKQAFVTALFEAQIVEATKKLIRRGGGKGKVMMANGNFIEVEVRQSSWKKINGKIGYGDAVIPGASMTERLGIKEIQLKVRDESGKQTVAAGNRQQNAAEGAEAH